MWTLRQRRYAALAAFMTVIAIGCVAAGTFEIHRYSEKVHDNSALRRNAHAARVALSTALVPLTGHEATGAAPDPTFRHVTATGTYLPNSTQFLADQTQDGAQGFDVVTPLRTVDGVLLVDRGFVATPELNPPANIAAAPSGTVTVNGWLQAGDTGNDRSAAMGHSEIANVNPAEQEARLGTPTYTAYLTLEKGAAGTAGLATVSFPDLSNPSGGAEQWQLASYVVQWYTFAVLALLAPFLIARFEIREARRRYLGVDEGAEEFDATALPAGPDETRDGTGLVLRAQGTVARQSDVEAQRWTSAQRLADRYGRSLGPDATPELAKKARRFAAGGSKIRDSRAAAHRSGDEYHGAYNDQLWELALADGELPAVSPVEVTRADDRRLTADTPTPRTIEPGDASDDR